jgi:N-acetylglucosaminyldiphosphoundecaprenol N-acetyl-beta-D-mannosaminyltransferase
VNATAAVRIGGCALAPVTLHEAVDAVLALTRQGRAHLVACANVDHVVQLERDAEFSRAYARASLQVADGVPLVALSRWVGRPLPERIAGSDLAENLLAAAERRDQSVFFLGGRPDVLDRAVERMRTRHPGLTIGSAAPRIDLDHLGDEEAAALEVVRHDRPDLLFLFLGAPKQEKWFWRRRDLLPPTVALGLGGAVEFLAGVKPRAPVVVQRAGCEWLWRLAHDPRRLAHRYLVRDPRFVVTATRALAAHRRG